MDLPDFGVIGFGWGRGDRMNCTFKSVMLLGLVLGLGACSSASSLLNSKSSVPQASNVQVGNNLAMPPDLQLATPGQTTDAYVPNVGDGTATTADVDVVEAQPSVKKVSTAGLPELATLPAKKPDIYEQYGISKTNPDGTPKTPNQLREEVRLAILAKKKQANPKYGTIANIGNIFKDQ
jgi:hypothetical protein